MSTKVRRCLVCHRRSSKPLLKHRKINICGRCDITHINAGQMSRSNNPCIAARIGNIFFARWCRREISFVSFFFRRRRDLIVGVDSSWIYGSEYRVLHTDRRFHRTVRFVSLRFQSLKFDGCPKRFIDEFQRQFTSDEEEVR